MHISSSKTQRLLAMAALGLAILLWHRLWAPERGKAQRPRREKINVCDRVLLQGEVGPRGRIPGAFQKEHYPVLKKEIELGRMLKVSMTVPRYHTTRMEMDTASHRFQECAIANDNFDSSALIKQLYPDQDTYKRKSSPLRDSRRPLGFAGKRCRLEAR